MGHPSEKYEFVSWDDEIPNINGKNKIHGTQTTNQLLSLYGHHLGLPSLDMEHLSIGSWDPIPFLWKRSDLGVVRYQDQVTQITEVIILAKTHI